MLTILNWNVKWATLGRKRGRQILDRIEQVDADVVCLTEVAEDFLGKEGFTITSEADYGYKAPAKRRKVLLWSRHPWHDADAKGNGVLPGGRYVAGTTETPIGKLRFVGVCIPWQNAHVTSGRKDRKPWEDHRKYLRGLNKLLPKPGKKSVLIGDFNQSIPRSRAPIGVHDELMQVLTKWSIHTGNELMHGKLRAIDHVATGSAIQASTIEVIDNCDEKGKQLSDHFGIILKLRVRG